MEIHGVQEQVRLISTQPPEERIQGIIAVDVKLAAISLVGRRLAVTARGSLALVPNETRIGDIIAILSCPFLVVLRPVEAEYMFVGECFVHRIIDREAVPEGTFHEVESVVR